MSRCIAILGPTASGKSQLALALAERIGGEIVNADALQVYRGFDIGTAKPSVPERQRVPHHLIDILEPSQRFSAGDFSRLARAAIEDIQGRERAAIVVGGSGLYLRALFEGLAEVPPGHPEIRAELCERLEREGLAALYRELGEVDPRTATRVMPGDTQRILRALEVKRVSGVSLSDWIAQQPFGDQRLEVLRIGLTLDRAILYHRIEVRIAQMVEDGWVTEVEMLLSRGLSPALPAFQAIGYRQIVGHLLGRLTLQGAIEETIRATRRYAKRQITWFHREPNVEWIPSPEGDQRTVDILVQRIGSPAQGGR